MNSCIRVEIALKAITEGTRTLEAIKIIEILQKIEQYGTEERLLNPCEKYCIDGAISKLLDIIYWT